MPERPHFIAKISLFQVILFAISLKARSTKEMKIKKSMLGGVILAFFAVSFSAFADESVVNSAKIQTTKIEAINRIIRQSGAQWHARENWVSRLSDEELIRMLGSNEKPTTSLDYTSTKTNLASQVDWRSQNGVNWLGEIMNQGNCGSCVAFATVATLEAQLSISSGLPGLHPTFSPEQLFACGGGGCDRGWMPNNAATFLKNKGIVDAACAPYTMGLTAEDVACAKTTTSCADPASRTYRISEINRPTDGFFKRSADRVKEALAHGPVMTTMTVYSDFVTYGSGIYRHVTGKSEGGHAVSIVGYDEANRAWIIRNSWGTSWGEKGFARISWDDSSGVGSNTWQFEVPTQNEYLTISSPTENAYVSGSTSIRVSQVTRNNLNVEIRQVATKKTVTTLACTKSGTSECISILDTTPLADGRYEASINSGDGNGFSQVRSFYVSNQTPQNLAIQITGASVDLTKPLKDRIDVSVATQAAPIPFDHVIMFVRQNGKVMSQKRIDGSVAKMKVGFNTKLLPNGEYELQFRGEITSSGKLYSVDSSPVKVVLKN